MKTISIVIPAHNEETNIPVFYERLQKILDRINGYDFEILFVNDGSSDGSQKIIEGLSSKDSRVRYVEFVRNFGKEIATTAGLHHANGDAVIMIDADLQHPIGRLPDFIKLWQEGAEVVTGIRKPNPQESKLRTWQSKLFYKLLNKVSDTKLVPNGTDFQLLDRAVVDEFNRFTERQRITRGLIEWLGFRTEYIRFTANKRNAGKPAYNFFKLVRLAMNSFISLSLFPLKLAGYLGMTITLFSGLTGLYMIVDRYILHDPFNFNFTNTAILVVLIIFLVGILLSSLGLVALYVGTIHSEVTNRPLYVMRKSRKAGKR